MRRLHHLTFKELFEKYKAGEIASVTEKVEITQELNDGFRNISKSAGRFHEDPEYGKELGYDGSISYGLLYEIICIAPLEEILGDNAVSYEWNVVLRKPISVGDILNIKCDVSNIMRAIKTVIVKIDITGSDGSIRSNVTVKCKFLK